MKIVFNYKNYINYSDKTLLYSVYCFSKIEKNITEKILNNFKYTRNF